MSKPFTWHDWRPRIEEALSAYRLVPNSSNRAEVRERIRSALREKNVVREKDRLIYVNDEGRAFSGMEQGDMGLMLFRAGRMLQDDDYIEKGMACMGVLLDDWSKGGLRRRRKGASWFHGQTNPRTKNPGGTLNKHLSATRELLYSADIVEPYSPRKARAYRKAGVEGAKQMVAGTFPSLDDFLVKVNGVIRPNAWAYYSVDWAEREGRYLDHPTKNAGYHIFVMRLLETIFTTAGPLLDRADFRSTAKRRSPLRRLLDAYERKLADGGLQVKSDAAPGGNFSPAKDDQSPLSPDVIQFFRTL